LTYPFEKEEWMSPKWTCISLTLYVVPTFLSFYALLVMYSLGLSILLGIFSWLVTLGIRSSNSRTGEVFLIASALLSALRVMALFFMMMFAVIGAGIAGE
jgi:hypothetical protein